MPSGYTCKAVTHRAEASRHPASPRLRKHPYDRTMSTGDVCTQCWLDCKSLLRAPDGSDSKESACNQGDLDSIPGLGRSPEEENGYPLQYSCLEDPMDRGAWWATICGVAKSRTRLNN